MISGNIGGSQPGIGHFEFGMNEQPLFGLGLPDDISLHQTFGPWMGNPFFNNFGLGSFGIGSSKAPWWKL